MIKSKSISMHILNIKEVIKLLILQVPALTMPYRWQMARITQVNNCKLEELAKDVMVMLLAVSVKV